MNLYLMALELLDIASAERSSRSRDDFSCVRLHVEVTNIRTNDPIPTSCFLPQHPLQALDGPFEFMLIAPLC